MRIGTTVDQLKREMSLAEFKEWIAYDRINPIGDERLDILAAMITSTVGATTGADLKIKDCIVKWWTPPITQAQLNKKIDAAFGVLMGLQASKRSGA